MGCISQTEEYKLLEMNTLSTHFCGEKQFDLSNREF